MEILCYNADKQKGNDEHGTRRFDKKDVKEVAELLKNGQVVAFPTDTVFGLGSFMRMRKPCAN